MLDLYKLLLLKKVAGDGGDITLETLNVSQNGTQNAPTGTAYNKVVASVPNTYAAGDEGKVVSNGALVSQTAHATVTQNGVVDTTLNNSVEVAVSGGGMELTTVADYTVSEAVSEIVINSGLGSYDYYEISFSGNTSIAEWIYPSFTEDVEKVDYINVSGGNIGTVTWDGIKTEIIKIVSGNDHGYVTILHKLLAIIPTNVGVSFNYLRLRLYYDTSTFQTGFRVLIKGGNFS